MKNYVITRTYTGKYKNTEVIKTYRNKQKAIDYVKSLKKEGEYEEIRDIAYNDKEDYDLVPPGLYCPLPDIIFGAFLGFPKTNSAIVYKVYEVEVED